MSYRPLFEDPTYDDDGNCVDEDATWQDMEDLEEDMANDNYNPYGTVNS